VPRTVSVLCSAEAVTADAVAEDVVAAVTADANAVVAEHAGVVAGDGGGRGKRGGRVGGRGRTTAGTKAPEAPEAPSCGGGAGHRQVRLPTYGCRVPAAGAEAGGSATPAVVQVGAVLRLRWSNVCGERCHGGYTRKRTSTPPAGCARHRGANG
jgi:hypothetical protein